jgi:hypothetical protein
MQRPVGIPQHCTRQKHGIRISTNKSLLRLLRIRNQSNRPGGNLRVAANCG